MRWPSRKTLVFIGAVAVGLAMGLGLIPLLRGGVSPVTAGIIVGVLGTLCIVAIGLGVRGARLAEAKRKAKEQIWIKH